MEPTPANLKPQPADDAAGVLDLAPAAVAAGDACVQCGLCLPACPTYVETADEGHSPRGRIRLMLGLHRGDVAPSPDVLHHLDACLNCRSCESACPSGVTYHALLEDTRQKLVDRHIKKPGLADRGLRWFLNTVMTHPKRLRLVMLPARVMQKIGLLDVARALKLNKLLPGPLGRMERLLGPGPIWPKPLPELSRGGGVSNMLRSLNRDMQKKEPSGPRVGLLPGCVGSVMYADVNRKAAELLCAAGADVLVPERARCCGAIPHHNQDEHAARELARQVIDAYLPPADEDHHCAYIVTTISGCGAMLREFGDLLHDDPQYAERAQVFVSRVRDVTEVLLTLGLPKMKHRVEKTVAYHDACHLLHAQKVAAEPREMLRQVPGLTLTDIAEPDLCCGAAGSYNLEHPKMAASLGDRKLANLDATGADVYAMGNVGCAMHLSAIARDREEQRTIMHPVELVHAAVFGAT